MPAGDKLVRVMQQAAKNVNPKTNATDLLYGVVQSVNPLTVLVDNRLSLTEEFLILSPFCYKAGFDINVEAHSHNVGIETISIADHAHTCPDVVVSDHTHKVEDKESTAAGGVNLTGNRTGEAGGFNTTPIATCGNAGAHKIHVSLWDDLKVADKLVMLRVAEGQAYLILYRDKLNVKVS